MIEITLKAEEIFHFGSLPITNSLIASWLSIFVLVISALFIRIRLKPVPGRLQNILEIAVEYFLNLMEEIYGSRERAKKVFPWVATFFIFILLSNWLGILPGFSSLGLYELKDGHWVFLPLLRSANADLNTTLALAITSVLITQIFGMTAAGFFRYSKRFFNFRGPIFLFTSLLEFFSEMVKVISFSFRLFGNIFAGEILLIVVAVLVPYFAPLPFYVLEIFIGFIQALVFTMLTIVFIKLAFLMAEEGH